MLKGRRYKPRRTRGPHGKRMHALPGRMGKAWQRPHLLPGPAALIRPLKDPTSFSIPRPRLLGCSGGWPCCA